MTRSGICNDGFWLRVISPGLVGPLLLTLLGAAALGLVTGLLMRR